MFVIMVTRPHLDTLNNLLAGKDCHCRHLVMWKGAVTIITGTLCGVCMSRYADAASQRQHLLIEDTEAYASCATCCIMSAMYPFVSGQMLWPTEPAY